MGDIEEAKRQISALPNVLNGDYYLTLKYNTSLKEAKNCFPEIVNLIEEAFGLPEKPLKITTQKWSQEKSNKAEAQLLLGFAAPESSDEISDDVENVVTEERSVDGSTYSLKGLVVGPESNRFADAKRFRAVWAGGDEQAQKKICQLRRFQDGTIKETVNIQVSTFGGYANDFVLDKIVHLISVHYSEIDIKVCRGFSDISPLYKVIGDGYNSHRRNEQMRKKLNDFLELINNCSSEELPIRKATAVTACKYSGDESHHLEHKATLISKDFWLKQENGTVFQSNCEIGHQIIEKSKKLPSKSRPIQIILDITSKQNFSSVLFERLAKMHLIQLSNQLKSKHNVKSLVKDKQLIVEYGDNIFSIIVQEAKHPKSDIDLVRNIKVYQQASMEALYERLWNVSNNHPCWWGALSLVHQWISASYLHHTMPELVADLLVAVILDGSLEIHSTTQSPDLKFKKDLLTPRSVESTFIRFLYHLSFADFDKTIYFLDKRECQNIETTLNAFKSAKSRIELPAMTILTPFDEMASDFTYSISDAGSLSRIVSCARHSLQSILKSSSSGSLHILDEMFSTVSNASIKSYDAVISLKPLTSTNKSTNTSFNISDTDELFPSVAGIDVVETFLRELEAAYKTEDNVMFHYSPEAHDIGVKLLGADTNDDIDLNSLIEDITIMGKGLVSGVRSLRSNENHITVE